MPRITHYKQLNDGSYAVVIKNVTLSEKDKLRLDNGIPISVEVEKRDTRIISEKQRKKIYAMCRDIEFYTGTPSEYLINIFKNQIKFLNMKDEEISLSNCSRKIANDMIDIIIQFIFTENIPMNHATSDLMKQDNYFLYLSTISRKCVICGKPNSDLAHMEAIGRGRNRKEMEHYGNKVLALCREHHNLQHEIGISRFNDIYHLHNSWIEVTPEINKKLQGR